VARARPGYGSVATRGPGCLVCSPSIGLGRSDDPERRNAHDVDAAEGAGTKTSRTSLTGSDGSPVPTTRVSAMRITRFERERAHAAAAMLSDHAMRSSPRHVPPGSRSGGGGGNRFDFRAGIC
jgi:hypothetical protein